MSRRTCTRMHPAAATAAAVAVLAPVWIGCASGGSEMAPADEALFGKPAFRSATSPDRARPKRHIDRSGAISMFTVQLAPNRIHLLAPWIDRSPPDSTGCPTCVRPIVVHLGSMLDGARALSGPDAVEGGGPAEWRRAVYEASVALERTHP